MASINNYITDLNRVLENGVICRFRYFNSSGATTDYDDEVSLTRSGVDVWASGLAQPVGKGDYLLVQEGRVKFDDLKLYVNGNVETTANMKIQIGSPKGNQYYMNAGGVGHYPMLGSSVYKKIYISFLIGGSLSREA